ncbi:hypothetical protein BDZ89DRAFT_1135607 [Hymenopellis radicata]|nr:hypothetical protein BDZ89DRAFT_1135607 [Hymenopellis radicata]
MLFNTLSVLALSAITFASPAPLDFFSSVLARGDGDGKVKDHQWDEDDCVKGYIKITTDDGKDFGYIGNKLASYGAYRKATCDDDKLLVEIDESSNTWRTLNGDPLNPFFAGVVGMDSPLPVLAREPSSAFSIQLFKSIDRLFASYFYLGGAAWPTLPGASPQSGIGNTFTSNPVNMGVGKDVETAIFLAFDEKTKCFDVQWVNSDFSRPETFVGVFLGTVLAHSLELVTRPRS